MKTKKTFFFGGVFLLLGVILLFGSGTDATTKQNKVNAELEKKFPLKSHHASLVLKCVHCHEGQGNDPEHFETPGDEGCLACHKSKQVLANRLKFMDALKVNPHNSIHDGPTLFCDECHNEHKPSINMCAECHEHDVKIWMKDTP